MRHYVVPTDFSENALKAAGFAYAQAKKTNSQVTLLHAYRSFHTGFQSDQLNEHDAVSRKQEAEANMELFVQKLAENGAEKNRFETICMEGGVADSLKIIDQKKPIDLVFMGTAGTQGFSYQFLGANTYHVAQETGFHLLVVPPGTEQYRVENIALFTNYEPQDIKTLLALISFYGMESVTYQIIHITSENSNREEEEKKLIEWSERLQGESGLPSLTHEVVYGDEDVDLVDEVAARTDIHLLALTMIERSFWERLFNKSLARAIVLQSKTPVFVTK